MRHLFSSCVNNGVMQTNVALMSNDIFMAGFLLTSLDRGRLPKVRLTRLDTLISFYSIKSLEHLLQAGSRKNLLLN